VLAGIKKQLDLLGGQAKQVAVERLAPFGRTVTMQRVVVIALALAVVDEAKDRDDERVSAGQRGKV